MDRTDLKILQALQDNGKLSNQHLSEQIGISTAACWRRVRALEDSGTIERYTALLNRADMGLNLCAFVHVTLARHIKENTVPFEEAIKSRPEVMECFAVTGDSDFILRVVTADIETLDRFLENVLFALPQISQVKSNIALREIKLTTALPLPSSK